MAQEPHGIPEIIGGLIVMLPVFIVITALEGVALTWALNQDVKIGLYIGGGAGAILGVLLGIGVGLRPTRLARRNTGCGVTVGFAIIYTLIGGIVAIVGIVT